MKRTPRQPKSRHSHEHGRISSRLAARAAALAASKAAAHEQAADIAAEQERERAEAQALAAATARRQAERAPSRSASEPNPDLAVRRELANLGVAPHSAAPLTDAPGTTPIAVRSRRPRVVALPGQPRPEFPAFPAAPAAARVQAVPDSHVAFEATASEPFASSGGPAMTLAQRLEAAKAAREAASPIAGSAQQPSDEWTAPRLPELAPSREAEQVFQQAFKPVAPRMPQAPSIGEPKRAPARKLPASRPRASEALGNAAVAYVDQVHAHIGAPLASVWRSRKAFAAGLAHLLVPLAMAYLFAHWSLTTQAIFLEGTLLGRLGAQIWLYAISCFVWTVAFMLGTRMLGSLQADLRRFASMGRDHAKGRGRD